MASKELTKAPTQELGGVGAMAIAFSPDGQGKGWGRFLQEGEYVPELHWPQSIQWFERMLYTDARINSLYQSTIGPLKEYSWALDPNGADEAMTKRLAADLGLPVGLPDPQSDAESITPGLHTFNFLQHLQEALLAVPLGHYFFELVGELGDDGYWHLKRLGPRAPATIFDIYVEPSGELTGIRQIAVAYRGQIPAAGPTGHWLGIPYGMPPIIPADVIVPYVWEGDARARWIGRPMLRPLYRHWLVKDMLIRVDAINHERAGGVPTVETDATFQGVNLQELQQLASQFRVGEDSGAALPPGAKLVMQRLGGTDVIASMNYHDEQMANVWQAMVTQLGQTATGNRALGQTFAGLQDLAQRAIARWFTAIFRDAVIRRWWSYNVAPNADGTPTQYPLLVWRVPKGSATDPIAPAAPPRTVHEAGVDAPPGGTTGLAAEAGRPDPTRAAAGTPSPLPGAAHRHGAPEADRREGVGGGGVGLRAAAEAGGAGDPYAPPPPLGISLPPRKLRRQPYAHEIRAATDFAAIDSTRVSISQTVQDLFDLQWLPAQVRAIHEGITTTKAGNPRTRITQADLARVSAPAVGQEDLSAALLDAARAGAQGAVDELAAQGLGASSPADLELLKLVTDHAQAVAQQAADGLSLAAARKAIQLAGAPGATPTDVAIGVTDYLTGLKHQWERTQLDGAVGQAQNAGRFAVFEQVKGQATFYASELLDANTCQPCSAIDGQQYGSLGEAMQDYPGGGYVSCSGGGACRGTLVGVAGTTEI